MQKNEITSLLHSFQFAATVSTKAAMKPFQIGKAVYAPFTILGFSQPFRMGEQDSNDKSTILRLLKLFTILNTLRGMCAIRGVILRAYFISKNGIILMDMYCMQCQLHLAILTTLV